MAFDAETFVLVFVRDYAAKHIVVPAQDNGEEDDPNPPVMTQLTNVPQPAKFSFLREELNAINQSANFCVLLGSPWFAVQPPLQSPAEVKRLADKTLRIKEETIAREAAETDGKK